MTDRIACSLTAAEYRDRAADANDLARDALRDRRPIAGGVRLTFDAGARERLESLIAAEAACCPFLTMALREVAGRLVLEVTGPETAAPIIEEWWAGSGS
jgi:hypothetical protein